MTKGTGGKLIHEPDVFGERGDLMGGYYYAVLTSGAEKYDAMPKSRIEEIKSRSEAVKKESSLRGTLTSRKWHAKQ